MAKAPWTMHPTVRAAVDEALREWTATYQASADDERRRAMSRHWGMRQRRLVPAIVYGLLAVGFLVFMMAALEEGSSVVAATLGILGAGAGALFGLSVRSLGPTLDELVAIAPALRLTRVGRAYVDSLVSLRALELPKDAKADLEAGLDRLLDEEGRLIAMRDEGVGRAPRPDALETERAGLAARHAAEADPVAREALAHGLATLERRLAAARNLSAVRPRLDAQLEMVAQAAEDVRDGLARLRSAPGEAGAAPGMDAMREALAHVQGYASALEAAVAEVRSI